MAKGVSNNKKMMLALIVSLGAVLIITSLFLIQFPLTGKVIVLEKESFEPNEQIQGSFNLFLQDGELIPANTNVIINLDDLTTELTLEELIELNDIILEKQEGDFYIKGRNISGSGLGYGWPGQFNGTNGFGQDYLNNMTSKTHEIILSLNNLNLSLQQSGEYVLTITLIYHNEKITEKNIPLTIAQTQEQEEIPEDDYDEESSDETDVEETEEIEEEEETTDEPEELPEAPLGEGALGVCNCTNCTDCVDKLNNASCTTVYLTTNIIDHAGTCIDSPVNFSNKIFDCQNNIIDGNRTGYGINTWNVPGNVTIKNCIITNFSSGIMYQGTDYGTITNNTVNDNTNKGIHFYGSDHNTLTNNNVNNNYNSIGIYLFAGSTNNTLKNNIVNSNGMHGISVSGSSNNSLTNNTAKSNDDYGIYIYDSNNNTLINNTANNNLHGISLKSNSNNNTLINNTLKLNRLYGIYVWDASSTNNTFISNDLCTNKGAYDINDKDDNTYSDNHCNAGKVSITGQPGKTGCDNPCPGPANCNCTNCTDCETKLTSPTCTTVYLTANIIGHIGTCIDNVYPPANFSNKVFDCQNNIIDGDDTGTDHGIQNYVTYGNDNFTVKNCIITDFQNGIVYHQADNGKIINNTLNSNTMAGIYMSGSNNTLINNTASNNQNYGIKFSGNNNTIVNNMVNNNGDGIRLDSSLNNTIINNIAFNNFIGIGVQSTSTNNTIINNIACNNDPSGADIYMDLSSTGNSGDNNCSILLDEDSNNVNCSGTCPSCTCVNCSDCEAKLNHFLCSTVRLTANITNHTGTCINNPTNFSNKVFDCQNNIIDGDDTGTDYGISIIEKSNITIKNCTITGHAVNTISIFIENSTDIALENMDFIGTLPVFNNTNRLWMYYDETSAEITTINGSFYGLRHLDNFTGKLQIEIDLEEYFPITYQNYSIDQLWAGDPHFDAVTNKIHLFNGTGLVMDYRIVMEENVSGIGTIPKVINGAGKTIGRFQIETTTQGNDSTYNGVETRLKGVGYFDAFIQYAPDTSYETTLALPVFRECEKLQAKITTAIDPSMNIGSSNMSSLLTINADVTGISDGSKLIPEKNNTEWISSSQVDFEYFPITYQNYSFDSKGNFDPYFEGDNLHFANGTGLLTRYRHDIEENGSLTGIEIPKIISGIGKTVGQFQVEATVEALNSTYNWVELNEKGVGFFDAQIIYAPNVSYESTLALPVFKQCEKLQMKTSIVMYPDHIAGVPPSSKGAFILTTSTDVLGISDGSNLITEKNNISWIAEFELDVEYFPITYQSVPYDSKWNFDPYFDGDKLHFFNGTGLLTKDKRTIEENPLVGGGGNYADPSLSLPKIVEGTGNVIGQFSIEATVQGNDSTNNWVEGNAKGLGYVDGYVTWAPNTSYETTRFLPTFSDCERLQIRIRTSDNVLRTTMDITGIFQGSSYALQNFTDISEIQASVRHTYPYNKDWSSCIKESADEFQYFCGSGEIDYPFKFKDDNPDINVPIAFGGKPLIGNNLEITLVNNATGSFGEIGETEGVEANFTIFYIPEGANLSYAENVSVVYFNGTNATGIGLVEDTGYGLRFDLGSGIDDNITINYTNKPINITLDGSAPVSYVIGNNQSQIDGNFAGSAFTLEYIPVTHPPFEPGCNCSSCADCESKLNDPACTVVNLTANITDYAGTCINNLTNFSNKVFDCKGFTIDGDDLWADFGIYTYSQTNNTIKNCVVTDFKYGIYLHTSDNNNLTGNTVNSNRDRGIMLSASSGNILLNNVANDNQWLGIHLVSSRGNTLVDNTANSNKGSGTYLYNSNYNNLTGNTANLNDNRGILLSSSSNNTLLDNTVNNNRWIGVHLVSSQDNNLTDTTANLNDNAGIGIENNSDRNFLADNIVENNINYGIYLVSSDNNTIYNSYFNNTINAEDDGINYWNMTKTLGTNIIGGPYLGGNYWSDYNGSDLDADRLGDTNLPWQGTTSIDNGGDWHPLTGVVIPPEEDGASGGGGGSSVYYESLVVGKIYTKTLVQKGVFRFKINNAKHIFTLQKVHENMVDVKITSTPIEANVSVGETKTFDLDDDGFEELSVTLTEILDNKAILDFELLAETKEVAKETGGAEEQPDKEKGEVYKESGLGIIEKIQMQLWWIIAGIAVILIAVAVVLVIRKKKKPGKKRRTKK